MRYRTIAAIMAILVVPSLLCLTTSSCIILPLPRVRPQVGPKRIEQVQVGVSTKQEVLALLKKASTELTEDIWIHDWFTRKLNVLVGFYGSGGVEPVGVREYRSLIVFDGDGRVSRFEIHCRQQEAETEEPDLAPHRSIELPVKGSLLGHVRFVEGSTRIVTGCGHVDICSWDADAPENMTRWEAPGGGRRGEVRLSPGGRIAAGGPAQTVLVQQTEDAWESLRPPGRGEIGRLAFSGDGSLLAVSRLKTVTVFDLASLREIASMDSPTITVAQMEFSPDGSLLAVSSGEWLHLFNVEDGSLENSLRMTSCRGFAFSPDGLVIALHGGSYVAVYQVADLLDSHVEAAPSPVVLLPYGRGEPLRTEANLRAGQPRWARQVLFSPSGERLAAVSDNAVVVVDLASGSVVEIFPHMDDLFHGLNFHGEDRLLTVQRTGVFEWEVTGPGRP